MRKAFNVRTGLVCGLAVVAAIVLSSTRSAEARPNYLKEFIKKYPKLEADAKKTKCNVCHVGKKKKMKNDYGTAMGKVLGAKKVKDKEKIAEALGKTEPEKSGTEGKTFGDLLKDGKLPGKIAEKK